MPTPSQHRPQWYDRMYNNRERVADSAVYLQRWQQSSSAVRLSQSRRIDLRYGPGAKETLDVFPGKASGAPVLVIQICVQSLRWTIM